MRRSKKMTDEQLIRSLVSDLPEPLKRFRYGGRALKPNAQPPSQCRHKAPLDKFGWGSDKEQTQKMA